MSSTVPRPVVACLLISLLSLASLSCGSNPASPTSTDPAAWRDLDYFGELVGTSWSGTARFTTADGHASSLQVSLLFLWRGVCDIPGWCAQGYSPFAWGTTGGVRTRILGDQTSSGYVRYLDVGEELTDHTGAAVGSGNWDTARVTGDRQRLVIVSTDFSWGGRRGVTYEVTRAPWPAEMPCPNLVSCGSR